LKGKINVRRTRLLTSCIAVIAAVVAFAGFTPLSAQAKRAVKPLITVLNPAVTNKMADRIPLSPRLTTLEGKTIYLVDISWGGPEAAYSVFEEIQSWFAQNIPSTKIVIKRKAGMYTQDDPVLWKEIAANAQGALIGISG
jgi:hypothetical protein